MAACERHARHEQKTRSPYNLCSVCFPSNHHSPPSARLSPSFRGYLHGLVPAFFVSISSLLRCVALGLISRILTENNAARTLFLDTSGKLACCHHTRSGRCGAHSMPAPVSRLSRSSVSTRRAMMSTLRLCVILRQFKCPQNIETTHQLLQQHINRGHNRLARMTGRDAPATHELRSSLRKRMFLLDHGPGSHMPAEKRFNHQGVKPIQKSQMNANQLKKLQQVHYQCQE